MNVQDQIKILQALVDGKKIEQYRKDPIEQRWELVLCVLDVINGYKCLDFMKYSYRIKPEPKELWVVNWRGQTYTFLEEDTANNFIIRNGGSKTKFVEVLE
jgi:hypothetical protein